MTDIYEQEFEKELCDLNFYVVADNIWPLVRFLPDGIPRSSEGTCADDTLGFWSGIRVCRIDHVCNGQSFKQSTAISQESSVYKRKCDSSYLNVGVCRLEERLTH